MQFKNLTPMLSTKDLQGTLAFYRDVLGFELDNFNEEWGWLHIHKDNVSLMFSLPNEHEPFEKPVCTGSFYFYTDDVDALWEKLKGAPYIYYGLENFEYGMREFAIKDNNGYILQFGMEVRDLGSTKWEVRGTK
jgi:uncharacterized glyoxalase superfamily protein PhnB